MGTNYKGYLPMPAGEVTEIIQLNLKRNPRERKRYWNVHLADGRQLSEHDCRWIDIPLHNITMLELTVMGQKYVIEKATLPHTFIEYIMFNTAIKPRLGKDKLESKCIGWVDGEFEHVIRIDADTGDQMGFEDNPIRVGHLHPASKIKPILESRERK